MAELKTIPISELPRMQEYPTLLHGLTNLSEEEIKKRTRLLIRSDLYFLLRYGCRRADLEHDWLFERCREVQAEPDGYLDLWARDHYKSTIITFGLTLQEVLNNPELTVGIFSHTRSIAKGFLRQIMRELTDNSFLQDLFPEILFKDPKKESPKWSEDDGLIIKRKSNPKESTIEAHGLVDGQPTSKHFNLLIFDDVVTKDSVTTPDMIRKVNEAWELAQNLGSKNCRKRHIGTRYHFNDTWGELIRRKVVKPRIKAATEDGTVNGTPVFLTKDELIDKRREQGPYTFACQQLQNPTADDTQGFKYDWFRFYDKGLTGDGMNKYILVDPANEKRKSNDYTSMWVIGLGYDTNYYVLDIIRDRLNLTERTKALFDLHRKWTPKDVMYEKYGMQADIEHIKSVMGAESYHFDIIPAGGSMSKNDRIRRLIPLFEQIRFYFPPSCFKTNYEGKTEDLVSIFIEEEYKPFPVSVHDDMFDALARVCEPELNLIWPMTVERKQRYADARTGRKSTWMSR